MPATPQELLHPARYPFTLELRTRFGDMDPNGHINNVAFAALFEDARVRFVHDIGVTAALAGRRVMVVGLGIDFLAEAHYPAPFHIHVGVLGVGRSSITIGKLAMQHGKACAYAQSTILTADHGKSLPLTDTARAILEKYRLEEGS